MNNPKKPVTEHPIHQLLADRWSPYAFSQRVVTNADLQSLFEAARWAPSSYNEQPWCYVVAKKENAAEFQKVLSCLVEANQAWAAAAPVLAIGIARLKFTRNGNPNKAAHHDLGAASAGLTLEATVRGLHVHQMIGIDPEKARETFGIPEDAEALTGIAIGYKGNLNDLPPQLQERERAPRQRKPLKEFVFGGSFGKASEVL